MQLKAINDKASIKRTCCIELITIERLEASCAIGVASAALKYKKILINFLTLLFNSIF